MKFARVSGMIAGLLFCTVLLTNQRRAEADLIIDVQDAAITAGGTGFADVLIRSDGIDLLDLAQYSFSITPIGAPGSSLTFSNPFDFTEDTDPNYVFFGDNIGILDVPPNSPTVYTAGDLTLSGLGVGLTPVNRLLARLDLQHTLGGGQTPAMAAGEQFTIALLNNADTFFEDPAFNPLVVDASSFSAANSGTITVLGPAAAVPEPTALLLFGIGAMPMLRRRRR